MRTISNAEFIVLLESGGLVWPPFVLGAWIYSRLTHPDASTVGLEIVRTAVPA